MGGIVQHERRRPVRATKSFDTRSVSEQIDVHDKMKRKKVHQSNRTGAFQDTPRYPRRTSRKIGDGPGEPVRFSASGCYRLPGGPFSDGTTTMTEFRGDDEDLQIQGKTLHLHLQPSPLSSWAT